MGVSAVYSHKTGAIQYYFIFYRTGVLICHLNTSHNALICPPKFCISMVFNFSWEGSNIPRRNEKQRLYKILGCNLRYIMGECKWQIGQFQNIKIHTWLSGWGEQHKRNEFWNLNALSFPLLPSALKPSMNFTITFEKDHLFRVSGLLRSHGAAKLTSTCKILQNLLEILSNTTYLKLISAIGAA